MLFMLFNFFYVTIHFVFIADRITQLGEFLDIKEEDTLIKKEELETNHEAAIFDGTEGLFNQGEKRPVSPSSSEALQRSKKQLPGAEKNGVEDQQTMIDHSSKFTMMFSSEIIKSHSGYTWHTRPQVAAATRTTARNIVASIKPGPTESAATATTPEECFGLFVTDAMVNLIVQFTNKKIDVAARKYRRQTATVQQRTAAEIRALLGILIFSGYRKDNHLNTKELWCHIAGAPFYKAAMSEVRFCFLLHCLRFDDLAT